MWRFPSLTMIDESHQKFDAPIDGAPVWVRALQAAGVGIAAGLALHLLLSLTVLQGQEVTPRHAPAECKLKKSAPARETQAPAQPPTPSVSIASPAPVRG